MKDVARSQKLSIITAPKKNSLHWKAGEITWGELISWLEVPANHKACGGYVLGRFRETLDFHTDGKECRALHRRKSAVVSRAALTLDIDSPGEGFRDRIEMLLPHAAILHTTWSSTPEEPRYRLILPTDRDMAPDEYIAAAEAMMAKLGTDAFDPGSSEPERYMFKPSTSNPDSWDPLVLDGPPVAVDDLLVDFELDLSDRPAPKPHKHKRNPFEFEGTIGAFNRAYEDWATLITEYELPYEDAGNDRWHLIGAAGAAGMGPVKGTDGLVYSHHKNDPAYAKTCSAFDLVRLHLFSELDEEAKDGTPVNKLPSHTAMLETAMRDARVVSELVGTDFDAALDDVADGLDDSWKNGFRLNLRTGKPEDEVGNWDLIRDNDPVLRALYYNEITMTIEADRDLPWRELGDRPAFDAGDRANFTFHVEREYGLRPTKALADDLMVVAAHGRRRNPIREYLEGLKWDGRKRVETCLPGVRPSEHSRMVARKILVAAVARMFDPGVKWDHMLVIYGPEGLGKSFWIEKISRGFSAPLGRINDKDTLLTLQRSWIVTADESHSLKKADFDAQKEFLTRTHDVFRAPYDRETLSHPRHCVIWGTTNDEVFLRNQEGNRRFLIVKSEDRVDFEALTDEYVDQVWAEAVAYYQAGESLFLTDEEDALAKEHREPFMEEDALTGIVAEYLDTLVPETWWKMSPADRYNWMCDRDNELVPSGTQKIERVCSAQIWVEAMGRRYGEHRRVDLLEITEALKKLPGWRKLNGRHRIKGYGPQVVFFRDPEHEDLL